MVNMKGLKFMTVAAMLATFFAVVVMVSAASRTAGYDQFDAGTGSGRQFDGAATYKAKCVVCHGQKAEKKFDVSLPDQQLIDIVLKGKKPEKPPNMPAYGEKGVTTEQAAALVEHMKQLKSAP
jgi:mono/diheme cytochrome c family protein